MKITKLVMVAVDSTACLSSSSSSLRLTSAMMMAPLAPMAPPSVGRGDADEDRAEHEEDQHQRRDHRGEHLERERAAVQRARLGRAARAPPSGFTIETTNT